MVLEGEINGPQALTAKKKKKKTKSEVFPCLASFPSPEDSLCSGLSRPTGSLSVL